MSTTQFAPKSQTSEAGRAYLDTALQIGVVMAEANQRLFQVQSDAATAALAENSKHLKTLLDSKDPAAALGEWAELYQANVRMALDVARTCFEIVPEIQAELAKLVSESFASYSNAAQHDLDKLNKAVTDGRDAAATAVKDFFAKGAESVSGPNLTKKQLAAA